MFVQKQSHIPPIKLHLIKGPKSKFPMGAYGYVLAFPIIQQSLFAPIPIPIPPPLGKKLKKTLNFYMYEFLILEQAENI